MSDSYPVWWEDTITLYNRFEDSQTQVVSWYKTVLTDCFWHLVGSTAKAGETVLDTKSIICRIPKNDKYLDKYKWVQLPNDEMSAYFTIGLGDILVKGEVDDEIDEYVSGSRSSDLLTKYRAFQGCLEVTEFAINTGTGKNNEHYLVRGL